jgi:predicted ATP-dependent endonuclease of OLD family
MRLKKILIKNYKSIIDDCVEFDDFTFFVGKNNYGKSNYLKAIDSLLGFTKTYSDIAQIQNDLKSPITIEGWFDDVKSFTPKLKNSKHKDAVEKLIDSDGLIRLRLTIAPDGTAETLLVNPKTNSTENVTGWASICKGLFPETVFVPATADTSEELQEKSTTALSKIKKEVMQQFFDSLSTRVENAFAPVDKFLNGEKGERSDDLRKIEEDFSEEMMGEFSGVKPSIRFTMPDSSFIGHGMKINLNDGFHECEIEQKGHGLQRTALFALMRLLSKHSSKDQIKPSPIFLIEELEAFLHPSAQKRLAEGMDDMSKKYQTIVSTHSPFVLTPKLLNGYRRVSRTTEYGSKNLGPKGNQEEFQKADYDTVKSSLAYSNNLVSLFSDIVVIVEGKQDIGFFNTILNILNVQNRDKITFVDSTGGGNSRLHVSYNFFKLMGFQKIFVICDLDCLFNLNFKELMSVIGENSDFIEVFRNEISFTDDSQPGIKFVLENLNKMEGNKLQSKIDDLVKKNIFVLEYGTPENYYSDKFKQDNKNTGEKSLWEKLKSKTELKNTSELEKIMEVISK